MSAENSLEEGGAPREDSVVRMRTATEGLRKAATAQVTISSKWPLGPGNGDMRTSSLQGAADVQGLTSKMGEWDSMMTNIDKKQEQLLSEQWSLFRTQFASLMGALDALRTDIVEIKENALMKSCWPDLERVVESMVGAHDQHGKNHDHLLKRVDYLDEFIRAGLDKHSKISKADLDDQKRSMEERLQNLEKLIGDNSDKIVDELSEKHNAVVDRLAYVEKVLGESLDDPQVQDEPFSTVKDRFAHLEGLINSHMVSMGVDHKVKTGAHLEYIEQLLRGIQLQLPPVPVTQMLPTVVDSVPVTQVLPTTVVEPPVVEVFQPINVERVVEQAPFITTMSTPLSPTNYVRTRSPQQRISALGEAIPVSAVRPLVETLLTATSVDRPAVTSVSSPMASSASFSRLRLPGTSLLGPVNASGPPGSSISSSPARVISDPSWYQHGSL